MIVKDFLSPGLIVEVWWAATYNCGYAGAGYPLTPPEDASQPHDSNGAGGSGVEGHNANGKDKAEKAKARNRYVIGIRGVLAWVSALMLFGNAGRDHCLSICGAKPW